MEAANRGAKDVDGRSVGCNIQLPHEQKPNVFLDRFVTLRYFFVRKTLLAEVQLCLCHYARRRGDTGRNVRSAHFDPDRQD